ncbi:MAG TPA: transglycosylase family protein [Acidimicrobiales bacterium]|nr:transglycosylase family protein [Acidimicrobiales bacterium]
MQLTSAELSADHYHAISEIVHRAIAPNAKTSKTNTGNTNTGNTSSTKANAGTGNGSASSDVLLRLNEADGAGNLPFPFTALQLVTEYRAAAARETAAVNAYLTAVAQERDAVNGYLTAIAQERVAVRTYLAAVAPRHPTPPPAPAARPALNDPWAALRQCESSGNYTDNTGNGYYGAYQFTAGSWASLGFHGLPSQAPAAQQDQAAQELQARRGWGQWPSCARRLGLL